MAQLLGNYHIVKPTIDGSSYPRQKLQTPLRYYSQCLSQDGRIRHGHVSNFLFYGLLHKDGHCSATIEALEIYINTYFVAIV